MTTVPHERDSSRYYLEGLLKLEAARDVIDAVLAGVWHGDRAICEHIADHARAAGLHFHYSELTEGRVA